MPSMLDCVYFKQWPLFLKTSAQGQENLMKTGPICKNRAELLPPVWAINFICHNQKPNRMNAENAGTEKQTAPVTLI